jgi:hypothetical protein
MVFVYGKQTDRAARIEVHDVRKSDVQEIRSRLSATVGELEFQQQDDEALPLLVACQPPVAMIRFHAKPAEAEILQTELAALRMPGLIASLKLPILGGASLIDLADDDAQILERTTVIRIIQQFDAIASKTDDLIEQICTLAKVPMQPPIKPAKEEIESIPNEDLNRVDPADLDADSLMYLLQRAQQISSTLASRKFATKLIATELPAEQSQAKLLAYATLINASSSSTAALETLQQAKAFAEAHDLSIANLLLSEVSLRLQAGDGEGFQKCIETISSRYGNEPEVMAQLQQMLISYGLIRPDGRAATPAPTGVDPAAAPSAASSGLWTPDGGTPAAPDDGEKKLWIPGMD